MLAGVSDEQVPRFFCDRLEAWAGATDLAYSRAEAGVEAEQASGPQAGAGDHQGLAKPA